MPIKKINGNISGTNTISKYGGPTLTLPMPNASANSGYKVPSNTAPAATTSNKLLPSKNDSRDSKLNRPPSFTFGARNA